MSKYIKKLFQILSCGYSLKSSCQDHSNKYPQHRVWKRTYRFSIPSFPTYLELWVQVIVYQNLPFYHDFDYHLVSRTT